MTNYYLKMTLQDGSEEKVLLSAVTKEKALKQMQTYIDEHQDLDFFDVDLWKERTYRDCVSNYKKRSDADDLTIWDLI